MSLVAEIVRQASACAEESLCPKFELWSYSELVATFPVTGFGTECTAIAMRNATIVSARYYSVRGSMVLEQQVVTAAESVSCPIRMGFILNPCRQVKMFSTIVVVIYESAATRRMFAVTERSRR